MSNPWMKFYPSILARHPMSDLFAVLCKVIHEEGISAILVEQNRK